MLLPYNFYITRMFCQSNNTQINFEVWNIKKGCTMVVKICKLLFRVSSLRAAKIKSEKAEC